MSGLNEYQKHAERTLPGGRRRMGADVNQLHLQMLAMGLAGESGEVVDELKKFCFHGRPLSEDKLIKEMGDVLWYLSGLASALGWDLSEVALANIKKLTERYPEGFKLESER